MAEAKPEKLENLGASAIRDLEGDVRLLFKAGKAITEINNYLNPCASTQPADMAIDARKAINQSYSPEMIKAYLQTLRKHHLSEEARKLKESYIQLRKIAGFD